MEEKKKNKIFIVSSCLIAILVIVMIIGIMPQMQLKSNKNNYHDETAHGSIANCATSSSRCSYGDDYGGKCCSQVGVPLESCTGNYTVMSGSCYQCSGTPFEYCTSCDSGYHISGGYCVADSDPVQYVSCCVNGTYYSSKTEEWCANAGGNTNITRAACEASATPLTCYDPNSNCSAVTVNKTSSDSTCSNSGGYYAVENACLASINYSITCYDSNCRAEQINSRTCPATHYSDQAACQSDLKDCWSLSSDGRSCSKYQSTSCGSDKTTREACLEANNIREVDCYTKNPQTGVCSTTKTVLVGDETCKFADEASCKNFKIDNCYYKGAASLTECLPCFSESQREGSFTTKEACDSSLSTSIAKRREECEAKSDLGWTWNSGENTCVPDSTCGEGYYRDENGCVKCNENQACFGGNGSKFDCPDGYTWVVGTETCKKGNDVIDLKSTCKLESVETQSVNTSKDANAKTEDSFYYGTITTSGYCRGIEIPCRTNNGTPEKASITGVAGQKTYLCKIYPETPCIPSTVSSEINGKTDDDTVSLIKYDWSNTPVSVCEKNPAYIGALPADYAGADVYWDNYGQCADGSYGYRERYHRTVSCNDEGGSVVITDPAKACYADSNDLKTAKKIEWLTAAEANKKGLTYKIKTGVDNKTEINEANHLQQCKTPDVVTENKYCYANNASIDDATETVMLTEKAYNEKMKDNSFKLRYQIKDSKGNPLTDVNACLASACYVENGTVNYKWAPNGSLDASKYSKVEIYMSSECKNYEACLAQPNEDGNGYAHVEWVDTKNEINKRISEGWRPLDINDADLCNPGACYKTNSAVTEYKWIGAGQDVPSGYTKVADSYCEAAPPEPYTDLACYKHILSNGTTKYEWGDFSKEIGYVKVDTPEKYCLTSDNCYLRTSDLTYHNGDYSLNPEYTMVDDANCKNVETQDTAFDKSTVMYIAMLFLAIAGVGLTYYGNLKRKNG